MKKKSLIILSLSIVLISVLIIAFSLFRKTETSSSTTTTTSSSVVSDSNYPSLDELKALLSAKSIDNNLQVLGNTQITTVLFQDKNIAVLSPESGEEIQLPIKVTDKEKNLFEIPKLKYAPKSLKIGDTFGLAKKENTYFAYKEK
ncbi:hypothetical protein EGW60_11445 [Enterococcus faecium]|uniref:hypothetical protein n=1 Tax=Enterococcus TaxID=1350 RepID=UPI000BBC3D44|nr:MULTISPECIES: hypothetical protein [Enterococcus]PCE00317.1 hypothetical protein CKY11_09310 [Enterococcus hirae]ROX59707.1 hypothetical protein EGW10_12070 [Enterococcus faecium]ROX60728.1 hypothetical protein EGW32_12065 [Enterococcus faecium]ROY20852.1 hypothetical protein EGW60_11445 [Enterococcus faecium]ROY54834.1 hypothetical protein EGW64_11450 [Enterococcus faecium]